MLLCLPSAVPDRPRPCNPAASPSAEISDSIGLIAARKYAPPDGRGDKRPVVLDPSLAARCWRRHGTSVKRHPGAAPDRALDPMSVVRGPLCGTGPFGSPCRSGAFRVRWRPPGLPAPSGPDPLGPAAITGSIIRFLAVRILSKRPNGFAEPVNVRLQQKSRGSKPSAVRSRTDRLGAFQAGEKR